MYARARRAAAAVVGAGPAEDVASEAVVRALVRWGRVQEYAERWVVVVASNLAVDLLRRQRVPVVAAGVMRFEDEVVERVDVEGLVRRLPARQRQVVALRYLAGCSEAEVAETLGVSLETVRTHLKRARRELRSSMTREVV
ncbi:sigma-70 family RNA polymerase sigma factor [Acidimicrobiaceae bacterium USS-CC1]|uniref:Sigma-70 family RNA polymerase sigma factor n=1 Tax=Acidiferrimicrobium australe TaxID=2664430 RepID=A0ABW9R1N8_9ACTN|nr:sigma-70 family RNA polymerase sigma factor [Acidiferrimicrobium australe]